MYGNISEKARHGATGEQRHGATGERLHGSTGERLHGATGERREKPAPPSGDGRRVLIVGDDPATVELLSTTMELAGYHIATAGSRAEAAIRLGETPADLVVLDMPAAGLGHYGGYPRVPVADRPPLLFLTGCESLDTLAPGLGPGTADYVVKPLRVAEVLARANLLLRARHQRNGRLTAPRYGDLVIDDLTCRAHRGGRTLDLTPAEYRLLRHLLLNSEHVLSKEQICRHVWGEDRAGNAIEKLVSRLRRKVDQEDPPLIHTRKGFGYWLGV
ncbi:response regulator transcription factor [Streptomyces sp. NPDC093085]|uniref:response regulator transcription factor n=1 Tax=Streptomyces sp. NPDC093085 TaxID=3155068 RepID=UPI003430715E